MINHEPIKLRWNKMPDGRESAFLDFYAHGKRKKEYLKIYRGGTISAKESRAAERLAASICAKRLADYNAGRAGITNTRDHRSFFAYYQECAERRIAPDKSESTYRNWQTALRWLREYQPKDLPIADIDREWCQGFANFLQNGKRHAYNRGKSVNNHHGCRAKEGVDRTISQNTVKQIYNKLRSCLLDAVRDGIILSDPSAAVSIRLKWKPTHREYLSINEVKKLMATPYTHPTVCPAFLFSCMTGLRYSDVSSITWGMVHDFNGYTRVDFQQVKTKGMQYLDLPSIALQFMGERKADDVPVFKLPKTTCYNDFIADWISNAGIHKHISFHCSRHTAAVSLLTADADLYTVSKILGHSRITTTEIYAKIVDSKRQSAMDKLTNLYGQSTDKISQNPPK